MRPPCARQLGSPSPAARDRELAMAPASTRTTSSAVSAATPTRVPRLVQEAAASKGTRQQPARTTTRALRPCSPTRAAPDRARAPATSRHSRLAVSVVSLSPLARTGTGPGPTASSGTLEPLVREGAAPTRSPRPARRAARCRDWLTAAFRPPPENGTLPQRRAALPLLLGHYRFPALDQEAWRAADVFAMGYHFFYDSGNDLDALLLAGRATMAVLGIALGLLVYAWSRRLFGATGGIVSVALYAFCPTLLANGPLATSDFAAALFFTASAWAVWALLHAVSPGSVLAAALAVAGLCLSKMSGILVVPMALVLGGIRLADGRPLPVTLRRAREIRARAGQLAVLVAAAALLAAIVLLLVWAFYDFRYPAVLAPDQPPLDWKGVLPAAGSPAPLLELARRHHLLPEAYLYGFSYMRKYAATRAAFLNGRHSWVGWPSFFPYSLVVKTPLWLLGLVLAGAAGAILRRPGGAAREPARVRRNLYRTAPLWVLLGVYWASAIASHLNIGHRHLLPTYPAMLVLAGGLAVWLEAGGRTARLLIAATALAYAVESAL